jgi:hypothetical protein
MLLNHWINFARLLPLSIVFPLLIGCFSNSADSTVHPNPLDSILTPISTIESYFQNHDSLKIVTVKGTITRLLSDDTTGDQHQRFIIQFSNGQTLLIIHNIDIAPRVTGISINSDVYVHGEYLWNDQGGLVHWTHHDPTGQHENGWIMVGSTKFQ